MTKFPPQFAVATSSELTRFPDLRQLPGVQAVEPQMPLQRQRR